MSPLKSEIKRIMIIMGFILCLAAGFGFYFFRLEFPSRQLDVGHSDPELTWIQSEGRMFQNSGDFLNRSPQFPAFIPSPLNANPQTLKNYYKNRAYSGAPPRIPHDLTDEDERTNKSCLACHQNGSWVMKWQKYAPKTPHPEFTSCRQCHVPIMTENNFRENQFPGYYNPRGQSALPGSPPPIPHQIQLRENCLACHQNGATPVEIRFDHPYRTHCRQCHAASQQEWGYSHE